MATAGAESPAGTADTLAEAQLVESIEFWMRAYPRRWRQTRGQELVDVVVDLAGPGAQRLDPRSAFDLVRGGWATRWREHPLPHTWLLYRMFDRRVPVAYRSWALDDIDGFWYPIRRFLGGAWPVFLIALIMSPPGSDKVSLTAFVTYVLVVVSTMFVRPEWYRSQARLKHVAPRFGEVPVEGTLVAWEVPLERVTARSGLTWAVLVLGTTGAASFVAALLAPKVLLTNFKANTADMGPGFGWDSVAAPMGGHRVVALAILLVALGVGALGAAAARRRLDRLLGQRLDQPYRVLRPVTASGTAGVLFSAMAMVGLIWLEVSGQIVLGLSVLLGTVALLLLPGAFAAIVVTRRADAHDLAGHDVWWIATRSRVPRVDRPAFGLRPQPGPVPEGVLVQPPGPTDPPHPATP
jgi:hypothetical protein